MPLKNLEGFGRCLSDETAIVTGGGRGIGRAIALTLARAGATVAVVSRTAEQVAATVGEIEAAGGKAIGFPADVRSSAETGAVVASVLEKTGRIDILVNNAGIFVWKAFADLAENDWDRILDTNLKASYLLIHAALPALLSAPRGRIVNVSSIHGTVGDANVVAHCAAKFGLIGLTKALAAELRDKGITVNALCPGSTDNRTRDTQVPDHKSPLTEKLFADDIAQAALFLVSPVAETMTGSVLDVWGGTQVKIKA
ncbi:MAG: SDR family oxidoreductase [Acidobacteria bacterium]|nr:SDR family oxidoreductase [Acidobacteriota bacterium]MCG3194695.1 3-oxoacyl-[acyl-carrier-protein] reductase FabG [Thermoanaerobaculia bacterium]MCK6683628.1 SDR family oxidoreductase [Thermoanaerobaculia bacterium]